MFDRLFDRTACAYVFDRTAQVGKDSFWYQYIKELDRQRARGIQAVESPLLWSDEELETLLAGGWGWFD